jgi:hypothetical protein
MAAIADRQIPHVSPESIDVKPAPSAGGAIRRAEVLVEHWFWLPFLNAMLEGSS